MTLRRIAASILITLILAAIALAVGLGLQLGRGKYFYDGDNHSGCPFAAEWCLDHEDETWLLAKTITKYSLIYLVAVGGPFGFIALTGDGRLRRALNGFGRWFWRGE